MLTLIVSFFKTHLQTALIASGILSVLATLSFQHLEIHHLSGKLMQCHAESITLEDSNKVLVSSLESQNEAVAELQESGKARRGRGEKALSAARINAGKQTQQAQRIEAQTATKDDCADMRQLVNAYVGKQQ